MTDTDIEIARLTERIEKSTWQDAAKLREARRSLMMRDIDGGVLEYSSNNSGGSWWVKDAGWYALAEAGWTVHWGRQVYSDDPRDLLKKVHPEGERWLGAVATSCAKAGTDPQALVDEWATLTGCSPQSEGCNCCGPPHSFTWYSPDGTERSPQTRVVEVWDGF